MCLISLECQNYYNKYNDDNNNNDNDNDNNNNNNSQ